MNISGLNEIKFQPGSTVLLFEEGKIVLSKIMENKEKLVKQTFSFVPNIEDIVIMDKSYIDDEVDLKDFSDAVFVKVFFKKDDIIESRRFILAEKSGKETGLTMLDQIGSN